MATFLFKGITKDGTKIGGAKKFNSEEEMKKYASKMNIDNVEIFKSETIYKKSPYSSVDAKEISIFCKQMSVIFFSYITLMEGVLMLSDQTDNKQLKIALNEIHDFMDKGYTFAETMAMYDHIFGGYLIKMVFIGESSGTLDRIFSDMSDYFAKEHDTRRKLKSAITYPLVLSVMMIAIIVFLIKEILPMFSTMLTSMGADVSNVTKSIIGVSTFFNKYGLIMLIVIVVLVLILVAYFKTEKGAISYDHIIIRIPGIKYISSRVITARFARSLAILLKSGIQLVSAVEQSIVLVDNTFLRDKFIVAYEKIKNGEDLSSSLQEIGVFPKLFLKLIIIGQSTGNLDAMLEKSADLFEDEVDEAVEKSTRLIEPILISVLSIVVGVILLAVMLPMINIMQSI